MWSRWGVALIGSALVGWMGYRQGLLSRSGMWGALLVGSITWGCGGWDWGAVLIAFFASSSLLSRYRAERKRALAERAAKGNRRDLWQALANGGWGAFLALVHTLFPHPLGFVAFVGAMAAVTADTWGTELGVLGHTPPRLITTGRAVPAGTSGAISVAGTLAALAGAGFIGLTAAAMAGLEGQWAASAGRWEAGMLAPVAAAAGLAGALSDSVLGAVVQRTYQCDACRVETESPVHRCGHRARVVRGWPWMNNDVVNLFSSMFGSLAATGMWLLLVAA